LRQCLAILVGAGALAAAGAGTSASTAVEARTCVQRASSFNLHILGDKDTFRWTGPINPPFVGIRKRQTFVAVWSLGGPATARGMALYGWITATGARLSSLCSETRAGRQPKGDLRAPVRVRNRRDLDQRFGCVERGRLVIEIRKLSDGNRLTVRMERTGHLIAVAEVRRGGGWLRASTRCDER
jgi:hypothetical protein